MTDQKTTLADALAGLPVKAVRRTKIGQVRELYEQILQARDKGYRDEDIVEQLGEGGLKLSVQELRTMLYRIRKGMEKGKENRVSTTGAAKKDGAVKAESTSAPAAVSKSAVPTEQPGAGMGGRRFQRAEVDVDDLENN